MKRNVATEKDPTRPVTHEGAPAARLNPLAQLRRSVMACLLWEDAFYEEGEAIAERIVKLVPQVSGQEVCRLAIEARTRGNLRHVPLLLLATLAGHPNREQRIWVSRSLDVCIQRADELTEFLAIYWRNGKCPLSAQVKKGLRKVIGSFDEYQLAKYNRKSAVRLRDVLRLVHPKPISQYHSDLYKRVITDTLETPDTWEVALSGGADKKEAFVRLLAEKKLGALAFLRNLRNMKNAAVSSETVAAYGAERGWGRVLPFRFIAAARAVPEWEHLIEPWMLNSLKDHPRLEGRTMILVDNSASMDAKLSKKSALQRTDAAGALAVLVRGICAHSHVISFGDCPVVVPARVGFALVDAIQRADTGWTTNIRAAIELANKEAYDRIMVITDEQSHTAVPDPRDGALGYFINVASYQNGVGYGRWTHIDGFSESVVSYIQEVERSARERNAI